MSVMRSIWGKERRRTVIRGTENGDELTFCEELITIFDDLVSPANEVEVVLLQERDDDVRPEREADTAIILAPAAAVLVGVCPEQVAEKPSVWNIGRPRDPLDLLHRLQVRAQSSVHAEDFLVNNGSDRQAVFGLFVVGWTLFVWTREKGGGKRTD